jgi:hypothetical protein
VAAFSYPARPRTFRAITKPTAGPLSATIPSENLGLIRFNGSLGDRSTVAAFDTP